mgnify:CR=1 FL=1
MEILDYYREIQSEAAKDAYKATCHYLVIKEGNPHPHGSGVFIEIDGSKLFSNEIIETETKKRNYKKQTDISKMQQIFPIGETEKAYIIDDGANGKITRGNLKQYYKYIAKSICIEEDGKIFAPYFLI